MKVYCLFIETMIDFNSGIHPTPATLLSVFENETSAWLEMQSKAEWYVKECGLSIDEYSSSCAYFEKNNNVRKLYIKEMELQK